MPSSACSADPRDLHSFPTRRSSDLRPCRAGPGAGRSGSSSRRRCRRTTPRARRGSRIRGAPRPHARATSRSRSSRPRAAAWLVRPRDRKKHTSELQSHSDLVCRLLLALPTPEISTLSLHDALPIFARAEPDREQAVLAAVREEDVGERLREHGAVAVFAERPDRMLARRAAAEVRAREQQRGLCGLEIGRSTRLNSSHTVISYAVFCLLCRPPRSPLFPYTTLFRSSPVPSRTGSRPFWQQFAKKMSANDSASTAR